MSGPPPPLPPPTGTDLAVIRARLDGRAVFGHRGARHRGRIVAATASGSLVFAVFTALTMAADDSPVPVVFSAIVLAGSALALSLLCARTARTTDARVRARLAAGAPKSAPRRRSGAAVRAVLALAVVGVGIAGFAAAHLVEHRPETLTAVALVAPVLLAGCLVVAVRTTVLAPAVGAGPVLLAVDRAIARRDLWLQAAGPAALAVGGLLAQADEYFTRSGPSRYLQLLTILLVPAAVSAGAGLRAADRALLTDRRLAAATPPETWLAGAPALPAGGPA